jgi:hypothetical protein
MLVALNALMGDVRFDVNVVDVDADEALVALYDEKVPVLVGVQNGVPVEVELCHYFLDEQRVTEFSHSFLLDRELK